MIHNSNSSSNGCPLSKSICYDCQYRTTYGCMLKNYTSVGFSIGYELEKMEE